jgi:septation ring formation regulator EzrA
MFDLQLFRFRSSRRDTHTDEQRLALIQKVVRSALANAQTEYKGLRARITSARSSATFLAANVEGGASGHGGELSRLEQELIAAERRLAQLTDHLAVLRN